MLVRNLTLEWLFLAGVAVLGMLLTWERICQWKWVWVPVYSIWIGAALLSIPFADTATRGILLWNVGMNEFSCSFAPLRWDLKPVYAHGQFCRGPVHTAFLKYDCDTHQRRPFPSKGLTACFYTYCFCNFRCEGHPCWPCSQSHWESTRHSHLFKSNSLSLYKTKGLSSHGRLYVGKRSK